MTGKHILSAALFSFVVLVTSVSVSYAQGTPQQTNQQVQQTVPGNATRPQTAQTTRSVSNTIKDRALSEIERRVVRLSTAIERINASTKLSDSVKQQMILSLQAEIDSLSDLQSTIETEVDEDVVREEVAKIRESYNVFAVYMPKVATLRAAEKVLSISDRMTLAKMRLLTQVSTLASTGEDTTELEQLLTDAEESIESASENAQDVFDTVLSLSPERYPQNRTQFQTARQSLQTARLSLIEAQSSLRDVYTQLQALAPNPQQSASGEAMLKKQPAQAQTMELKQDSLGVSDQEENLRTTHQVQTQGDSLERAEAVSQPQQVIQ